MAENKAKSKTSYASKYRKKLGAAFDSMPSELKASTRRVQVFGEILLNTIVDANLYQDDPLCTKAGVTALKGALRFYNIGVSSLTEVGEAVTDLDGMSDSYKEHVALGVALFDKTVDFEKLEEKDLQLWRLVREILASHHEKWDGSGYPEGISGADIPLSARICAVCNLFENLTTSTVDRDKMTNEAAIDEIARRSGTYFDPVVIDALTKSIDKLNENLENGTIAKATAGNNTVRAIEQLYRPVHDYANHSHFGYYTDMRLNDSELGVVSSCVFLPIAEKTNKINDLTKWLVEEACDTILYLQKRRRATGEFFLYLSVKSLLKKNFTENLMRIVSKSGVDTASICFVITESIFSFNIDNAAEALLELHNLGFKLALGGSAAESLNFSVLQKLEVDYIFISSELVANILISTKTKQIVSSVIELAHKLEITVIADGVSEKQQAKSLYNMGCNIMCGSYYGRYTAATII